MKGLVICLCVLFSAISGEPSPFSCRIDEGPNIGHPPTNSPSPPYTPNTPLLAAQDGMVYLVELNSGKILWSFNSGPPIYSLDKGDNHFASYIDYEEDGNLYMHRPNNKKEKIPNTPDEYLGRTPHFKDGGIIVGSKNTTVFLIDPKTGKVIYRLHYTGSENNLNASPKEDFKELNESPDSIFYVVRKDYRFRFFLDTLSENSFTKSLWCLEFSDIESILQCEKFISDKKSIEDRCTRSAASHKIRDNNVLESLLMLNH
ncbi:serine/threonine-protein kinase/endoribonuclease IRE1b-like [Impatiens glandulifera]|uniref:serine/threonine-protein kinase/endoribonuclease IRE1b-like n=1 Tax=Impatiens glandulifera TaxID=253017 RepID=UPI001FB06079|nr:serine/threonine-protein kinase/endoribonuclease IRE1b-like [Impatiens glandulifera]